MFFIDFSKFKNKISYFFCNDKCRYILSGLKRNKFICFLKGNYERLSRCKLIFFLIYNWTCNQVKHNKGQCSVAAELKIQVLLFLKATCFLWFIMSEVGMIFFSKEVTQQEIFVFLQFISSFVDWLRTLHTDWSQQSTTFIHYSFNRMQ